MGREVQVEEGVEVRGADDGGAGADTAGVEPDEVEPVADGSADLRITGWLEPLKSTWNRTALLALLIPALILLVIAVA